MENGSSLGVFPARIFPSLVKALDWRVQGQGYGSSTPDLLASFNPATQSWRTSEPLFPEDWIEFSGALPRSGTMRNGKIYAPPMSERPTVANESGSWPTPVTIDSGSRFKLWPTPRAHETGDYTRDRGKKGAERPTLTGAVKLWPTPRTAGMCGETGNWNQLKEKYYNIEEARKMGGGKGGQLNPTWVDWLMGYPLGWTDCDVSGMRLSLLSRN